MSRSGGSNPSGSQRYRCGQCNRVYTPEPVWRGYAEETRLAAIRMYWKGKSYGTIARMLKVNQSVENWVNQYTASLQKPGGEEAELEGLIQIQLIGGVGN